MDIRGVAPTVLIVDDNRATRDALRAVLVTKGYRVAGGTDALKYLRAGGEAASIVLVLDLAMPGMSGYEVHGMTTSDSATWSPTSGKLPIRTCSCGHSSGPAGQPRKSAL